MNLIIAAALIAALKQEVVLLETELAQQQSAQVQAIAPQGIIGTAASTSCPTGDNVADGAPDPCNPYSFKMSNCPPSSTIAAWNALLSRGTVPAGYYDLTAADMNAGNPYWKDTGWPLTDADKGYCGIIVIPEKVGQ